MPQESDNWRDFYVGNKLSFSLEGRKLVD